MKLLINSDSLTNSSGVYTLKSSYSIDYKDGMLWIDKLIVPQSYYNIVSKTIKIDSTTIAITDGQYNIADLCSTMQALIRTGMSDATFTVTYNANTLAVTIAHTGANFAIDFTTATSIAAYIGFTPTLLSGAITYTSDLAYNPYKMGTIGFCTDLMNEFNPVDNTANIKSLICWIPQVTDPDAYVFYNPNYVIKLPVWNKKTQIRDTGFWFIRPDGSILDFKGTQWFAEININ